MTDAPNKSAPAREVFTHAADLHPGEPKRDPLQLKPGRRVIKISIHAEIDGSSTYIYPGVVTGLSTSFGGTIYVRFDNEPDVEEGMLRSAWMGGGTAYGHHHDGLGYEECAGFLEEVLREQMTIALKRQIEKAQGFLTAFTSDGYKRKRVDANGRTH